MNVEKIIRVLGYIVYVALWSPFIVVCLVVLPVVWLVTFMRSGMTAKEAMELYAKSLKVSFQHDANFIRTGIW